MGLLTGKFGAKGPWPKGRERQFSVFDTEQLEKLLAVVKSLSEKYEKPMSAIALNWCIAKGTIPLGGARTAEHVTQNSLALGFRLTKEEIAALDEHAFLGENRKHWNHG